MAGIARWALLEEGIRLLNRDATPGPHIEFFDFANERLKQLVAVPETASSGISVSLDGQRLPYDPTCYKSSDIMLAESFR